MVLSERKNEMTKEYVFYGTNFVKQNVYGWVHTQREKKKQKT